jgi:hypothetical protein
LHRVLAGLTITDGAAAALPWQNDPPAYRIAELQWPLVEFGSRLAGLFAAGGFGSETRKVRQRRPHNIMSGTELNEQDG